MTHSHIHNEWKGGGRIRTLFSSMKQKIKPEPYIHTTVQSYGLYNCMQQSVTDQTRQTKVKNQVAQWPIQWPSSMVTVLYRWLSIGVGGALASTRKTLHDHVLFTLLRDRFNSMCCSVKTDSLLGSSDGWTPDKFRIPTREKRVKSVVNNRPHRWQFLSALDIAILLI